MKLLDQLLGWFLVVMGCIHNFVVAPQIFDELSTRTLWFVSGGLILWYAGFINLLRARAGEPTALLLVFCVVTNASLLAFVLLYAFLEGNWAAPEAIALIATVAALTVLSIAAVARARRSP